MTNEYEVAAVVEVGKAQDVVLGQKSATPGFDSLTGEFDVLYIRDTNDNE